MGGYGSSPTVTASTSPTGDFDYKMHLLRQAEQQAHREECKEDNYSETVRHPDSKDGVWRGGIKGKDGNHDNLWSVWCEAVKLHADKKCLGYRVLKNGNLQDTEPYTWETYKETGEIVDGLVCGLEALGVKPGSNVGVFSRNRAEWIQAMLSCQGRSARTVALYDTLGDEALEHILNQAEIEVLFTEKNKLGKLQKLFGTSDHKVHHVIVFDFQEKYGNTNDKLSEDELKAFNEFKVEIVAFSQLASKATKKIDEAVILPKGKDLANIMYTSGTTGLPKGVMLSHLGVCCAIEGAKHRLGKGNNPLVAGDSHYSYLPLAHIFELMVEICSFSMGMCIGYSNGNIKRLAEDLEHLRPNLFIGVPRIYSKFFEKFWAQVTASNAVKKKIAKNAFGASSIYVRDNQRSGFYDKVVWKGAAGKMGLNETKLTITGAAPMPGYLMEFMKLVTNCPMIQGYGLTETTAAGGISIMKDATVGHIGIPGISNEMRLMDVPEMNYLHTDKQVIDGKDVVCPRGEIQIRGEPVFNGYYKMPDKTKECLFEDGWFATGDIGRINPNGTVSIIDRKKNIFKMSQGEYIAVEKVENQYGKSASVNQVWVYGNSHKSFIVAVVVPNALWVAKKWGNRFTCDAAPAQPEYNAAFTKMATDNYDEVKKWVFDDMKTNVGKLKGFEKIRDIHMELELDELLQGFNVVNNCLTPSFKLKRPQLLKRYTDKLKALYTANNAPPQQGEKW